MSNAAAKRILTEQLKEEGPKVHDVMRDLGIDCTAGRLRRVQTMKARRKKAGRKTAKLASLKIPSRAIKLKLYKGSIIAGISWGHQAMGLAPQVRRRIRATMGRQIGLQKTGNLDILFSMHPRHKDPDYAAFTEQIKVYHKFYGNWPEALAKDLSRAWAVQRDKLQNVQYRWQHAKGPVRALQCYLMERGWTTDKRNEWTKPGHNGDPDFKLNMNAEWFYLQRELERARQWETVIKVNKRTLLQEVQQPLDWLPWRRLSKGLNKAQNSALQTWRQGALVTKTAEADGIRQLICPHCGVEANTIHVLWLCKETQKAFPPLDPIDKQEIESGLNLEFWSQGLLQLPRYELSTGGAAVQTWGSWTVRDEVRLQGIDVVTIGLSQTSADPRLRHFVVAIVRHTLVDGELYRKGAVTTVLPEQQSTDRAWYYGLRMLAHYVDLQMQVRVQILSTKAWEAWVHGKHAETFHDLQALVTHDQRSRIRPMILNQQQLKEMPPGPYTVKARMRDANKVAKEIAMSKKPESEEEGLRLTDHRYGRVALLAIQRIRHLLETKDHYLHQAKESGKKNRQEAKARKDQLFLDIGNSQGSHKHKWLPRPRGLQCQWRNKRITKHLKVEALQMIHEEDCPGQASVELTGGAQAKTQTKTELIQSLLQGTHPQMTEHQFVMQTNYIVCARCSMRLERNLRSWCSRLAGTVNGR